MALTKVNSGGLSSNLALTGTVTTNAGTNWAGTVSESSTSAVIERGSNSNGEFIKFADGTLINLMDETASNPTTGIDIGAGYYRGSNLTKTLPAAFTNTDYQFVISSGRFHQVGPSSASEPASASQIGYNFRNNGSVNAPENVKIFVIAIGRWY
tara:strand:+ start:28 stop:489 length:462 start_codon:yes stop_codon:yes gene_type:complete